MVQWKKTYNEDEKKLWDKAVLILLKEGEEVEAVAEQATRLIDERREVISQETLGVLRLGEQDGPQENTTTVNLMHGFGKVIEYMKRGHKMARTTWNAGRYVAKVDRVYRAYCVDEFATWPGGCLYTPTVADMEANDWYVVG